MKKTEVIFKCFITLDNNRLKYIIQGDEMVLKATVLLNENISLKYIK